jgi:hypothetical protein
MTTPQENFGRWAGEHYEMVETEPNRMAHRCCRCGAEVSYLTKHAVVRHGDDIDVMPVRNDNEALADAY